LLPTKKARSTKADIIFLSVLFEQHPEVAKVLTSWKSKTIIDTLTPLACHQPG
jgi:predicted dinucleotide-binding enzyme